MTITSAKYWSVNALNRQLTKHYASEILTEDRDLTLEVGQEGALTNTEGKEHRVKLLSHDEFAAKAQAVSRDMRNSALLYTALAVATVAAIVLIIVGACLSLTPCILAGTLVAPLLILDELPLFHYPKSSCGPQRGIITADRLENKI